MSRSGQILIEVILAIILLVLIIPKIGPLSDSVGGYGESSKKAMKDAIDHNR